MWAGLAHATAAKRPDGEKLTAALESVRRD
jgi:hypothetical protein